MAERLNARCLCGEVRFSAIPSGAMAACHCSICRRSSGGVYLLTDCGDSLEIDEGQKSLGVYASSDHGERGFCKACGSSLFWRVRHGKHAAVSTQAFDDPGRFKFVAEIFIDDKPSNYDFSNDTARMTGAEFVASLQAGQQA